MKCNKVFFLIFLFFATNSFCSNFSDQRTLLSYLEDQINELSTTMQNIKNNPLENLENKNNFVVNTIRKENLANNISDILTKEFLQKQISPKDPQLTEKLTLIHKMLNLCYLIQNSTDISNAVSLKKEMSNLKKQIRLNFKPKIKTKKYSF